MSEEYEETLCIINEVHVFKIPPRQSSEGYRAEGWAQHHIWSGRCKVVARGKECQVRLEDRETGKIFAICPVNTKKGGPQAIEKVIDSSRYFVLRIEDKRTGKYAFIGIGFQERSDAFDFSVSIQDHQKRIERLEKKIDLSQYPTKDYSMKEGETIKVNLKVKTKDKVRDTVSSTPDKKYEKKGNDDYIPILKPPEEDIKKPSRKVKSSSSTPTTTTPQQTDQLFSDSFSDFMSAKDSQWDN